MNKEVMLVNGAGVSPSRAPVEAILRVDLYGPLQPKQQTRYKKSGLTRSSDFYPREFQEKPLP